MASTRRRSWADTRLVSITLVSGTPQSFDLLVDAPVSDTLTVTRIIGDVWVMYDPSVTVVDSLSELNLGIGVSSREAFDIGGASLPRPFNTTEYPPRGWLYVNTQPVVQSAEATGVLNHMAHFKFDVGAMRKIDKGVLFMTLEQFTLITGGAMQVLGRLRTLCLT